MGLEISYAAALGAGVISFLSPCVLPLVPAYLCFIAGTSLDQVMTDGADGKKISRRVAMASIAFVLGFSTVFIAMGATASALNRLLLQHLDTIAQVAGVIIVLFGLHFMGLLRIPFLYREWRVHTEGKPTTMIGAYVVGLAFAFGWTPCVGPILATILTVAASRESLGFGVSLLATYALGLGVPFILAAFAIKPFMGFLARFRQHVRKVEFATGGLLAVAGVLIFTNSLSQFGFYLIEWFPALGRIG
jgi:cytochrome c-type biogenesis protein